MKTIGKGILTLLSFFILQDYCPGQENWSNYEGGKYHQNASLVDINPGKIQNIEWMQSFKKGNRNGASRNIVTYNDYIAISGDINGVRKTVNILNKATGNIVNRIEVGAGSRGMDCFYYPTGIYADGCDAHQQLVLTWDPSNGWLYLKSSGDNPSSGAYDPLSNLGSYSGGSQSANQKLGGFFPVSYNTTGFVEIDPNSNLIIGPTSHHSQGTWWKDGGYKITSKSSGNNMSVSNFAALEGTVIINPAYTNGIPGELTAFGYWGGILLGNGKVFMMGPGDDNNGSGNLWDGKFKGNAYCVGDTCLENRRDCIYRKDKFYNAPVDQGLYIWSTNYSSSNNNVSFSKDWSYRFVSDYQPTGGPDDHESYMETDGYYRNKAWLVDETGQGVWAAWKPSKAKNVELIHCNSSGSNTYDLGIGSGLRGFDYHPDISFSQVGGNNYITYFHGVNYDREYLDLEPGYPYSGHCGSYADNLTAPLGNSAIAVFNATTKQLVWTYDISANHPDMEPNDYWFTFDGSQMVVAGKYAYVSWVDLTNTEAALKLLAFDITQSTAQPVEKSFSLGFNSATAQKSRVFDLIAVDGMLYALVTESNGMTAGDVRNWDFQHIVAFKEVSGSCNPVSGVTLDQTSKTINIGDSFTLNESIAPSTACNTGVSWSSSNTTAATVSGGTVNGIGEGTATIMVTTTDGGHTASCNVTVNKIDVIGVSLDQSSATISLNNDLQLTETVSPGSASDKSVNWSSSNTSVATVDANGLVSGVGEGNATITITTNDGGFTATCAVTVEVVPVSGISLAPTSKTISEGATLQLTESIIPANATDQSVSWSSDDQTVATVSSTGLVTAVAVGTATITVTSNDGDFTATSVITVEEVKVQNGLTGDYFDNTDLSGSAVLTRVDPIVDFDWGSGSPDASIPADGFSARWTGYVKPIYSETYTFYAFTNDGNRLWVDGIQLTDRWNDGKSEQSGTIDLEADSLYTIVMEMYEGANTTEAHLSWSSTSQAKETIPSTNLFTDAVSQTIEVSGVNIDNCPGTGIEIGNTVDLEATVSPANADNKTVSWSTSDASIATVNTSTGLVTAIAPGLATITITSEDGGYTDVCAITVNTVPVTSVQISNCPTANLLEGATVLLSANILPGDATNQSITWSSSNETVATVNSSGLVTAVAPGNSTITVTTEDGSFTDICNIIVPVKTVQQVSITNCPSAGIDYGSSYDLEEQILPTDAANKNVTWTSSNESIATVNTSGVITPVSDGSATITVTTEDGNYSDACLITINDIAASSVSIINCPGTDILEGVTVDLNEVVLPANATDKSVSWSSSDNTVASVNANGVVTASIKGNTNITVSTNDGGHTDNCAITVTDAKVDVTEVNILDCPASDLEIGNTVDLSEEVLPTNATNKNVSWASSNGLVAAVNASTGLVTANAEGTATITVTTEDQVLTNTCDITVTPVLPSSVNIDNCVTSLEIGSTADLNATVLPANATDNSISWSSSNSAIFSVDQNGLVTCLATGTANITATTNTGMLTDVCSITSSCCVPPLSVSITNCPGSDLNIGNTVDLNEEVLPVDANDKTVTWTSSNSSIASVNSSGFLIANAEGTVDITVETNASGLTDNCQVTILPDPIDPVSVSINNCPPVDIVAGESIDLEETVLPVGANDKSVNWNSLSASVATVDDNGLVTALTAGNATIQVTTNTGGFTDLCMFTVVSAEIPVTSVNIINCMKDSILEGGSGTLLTNVEPNDASDKSVTWNSSNPSVVSVDNAGNYMALAAGTANITATSNDDPGLVDACQIVVYKNTTGMNEPLSNTLIYPNPANDKLSIVNAGLVQRVEISNITGQVNRTIENVGNDLIEIDVSDLESGIYMIQLQAGGFGTTRKIIIE